MTAGSAQLLNGAYKARNALYEELFGQFKYSLPKGNVAPTAPDPGMRGLQGSDQSGAGDVLFASNMTALKITVLAYPPAQQRPYWMYITHGLSNPWFKDNPDEASGFGCELMVKSNKDSRWAVRLLRRMTYYILSFSGTLS